MSTQLRSPRGWPQEPRPDLRYEDGRLTLALGGPALGGFGGPLQQHLSAGLLRDGRAGRSAGVIGYGPANPWGHLPWGRADVSWGSVLCCPCWDRSGGRVRRQAHLRVDRPHRVWPNTPAATQSTDCANREPPSSKPHHWSPWIRQNISARPCPRGSGRT